MALLGKAVDRCGRTPGEARSTAGETADRERRPCCQNARRPAELGARRQPCAALNRPPIRPGIPRRMFGMVLLALARRLLPADMPTGDWFAHYADSFETVELNAPFYSWPTTATVRAWFRQVERRKFIYAIKASNSLRTSNASPGLRRWCVTLGLDMLGPHMGCFLFQLPPSFHFTQARLDRILRRDGSGPAKRRGVPAPQLVDERVYAAFRASRTLFCSCSAPRLPDELVETTADDVYVRFHGANQWYRHDYTQPELAVWAGKIRASGAVRVWAYFNNDRDGYAVKTRGHCSASFASLRQQSFDLGA